MKASIEVSDNVIVRCFKGDVYLEDILESWKEIFNRFDNLGSYKGILTDFLEATMHHKQDNLRTLVNYLNENKIHMMDMKIAIVIDTPQVSNTMMIGQQVKRLQIRPFSTRKAAIDWISI